MAHWRSDKLKCVVPGKTFFSSRNFPFKSINMTKPASVYVCVGDFVGRFSVAVDVFISELCGSGVLEVLSGVLVVMSGVLVVHSDFLVVMSGVLVAWLWCLATVLEGLVVLDVSLGAACEVAYPLLVWVAPYWL